jgi:hypothetical protein
MYMHGFARGIREILQFEQTGQELVMCTFFCSDLNMVALQKYDSQSTNWRAEV